MALVVSCLLGCSMEVQYHSSEDFNMSAYNLMSFELSTAEACPTRIGSVVVTNEADEAASYVLTSTVERVVLGEIGSERPRVSMEVPAGGRIRIPVSIDCGPPAFIRGTLTDELRYPSGAGGTGGFSVLGSVR